MALPLLIAVVAIGFAALFFRKAAPIPPAVAAGLRLTLASLLMMPCTVAAVRRGRLTRRHLKAGLIGGLLYGLHFGTWVTSLTLTSVAASVTLVTATPLMLAVVGWLAGRDAPDGRLWLAIGLGVIGVIIIGGSDLSLSPDALIGDALALAGAVAMALYMLVVRRLGPGLDVAGFAGVTTGVGALCLMGLAVIQGAPLTPPSLETAGYLVLAALVPQLIGHNLITWVLRHTTPTVVGMATVGEPVVATLLAWLWLGETVPPRVALGCVITLSAVLLALARRR